MFGRAEVRENGGHQKGQSVKCWVRPGGRDGRWVNIRLEGQTGVSPTGLYQPW